MMKITSATRSTTKHLIENLMIASSALESAAILASDLGSGTRTGDVAGSFELRAFKLGSLAQEIQASLDRFDARVAAAKVSK